MLNQTVSLQWIALQCCPVIYKSDLKFFSNVHWTGAPTNPPEKVEMRKMTLHFYVRNNRIRQHMTDEEGSYS